MTYLLTFLAGFICGTATWLLYMAFRFVMGVKAAQREIAEHAGDLNGPKDQEALQAVEACKNRLRWQKRVNPEWLPPLVDEVPQLVREIARIYYPQHPEPLLAPGLSQFSRAVHLAALDLSNFLQNRSIGRLVDVSASTAVKTWEMTHKIANHEAVQTAGKWYKRLLPVWQVLKYKSPMVWAGVAVSNVAARTLQPAIIDILARRTMDLYSGRIGRSQAAPPIQPVEEV
ncbi:hypothetical protein SAMN02745166_00341 [Prosthecobacter debontii]|uniref:Uncharacterized protein n=1 Tax=Prosthecobacter debontii TaxID=48467 RepID=A0A1T4WJ82_9BACT|nr:hypothetical protein [Prosthecobacter debontii]SKA77229.1 hypothetical protein SAMN02745166_00341 [Prosthecobacter debontii]